MRGELYDLVNLFEVKAPFGVQECVRDRRARDEDVAAAGRSGLLVTALHDRLALEDISQNFAKLSKVAVCNHFQSIYLLIQRE